ncbi:OmpA family protein [Pseudomaricurvus sp.]|uniref:OmpA family protein n=1 Tax=Pseudomaricurvus sp. TaxID=2004510 RepID=UPI003F6B131D
MVVHVKWLSLLVLGSLLSGCFGVPDMTVQRPKYDDVRDFDGDGVINQRDKCAHSPKGAHVNNEGCAGWSEGDKKETFTVDFDYDKSVIRSDQQTTINHLVSVLNQYASVHVELIGDTSPEGTLAYNQALAKRRVDAIATALQQRGIASSRITTHIFTEENALVSDELKHIRERRTKAILHHAGQPLAKKAWTIYSTEEQLAPPQ